MDTRTKLVNSICCNIVFDLWHIARNAKCYLDKAKKTYLVHDTNRNYILANIFYFLSIELVNFLLD